MNINHHRRVWIWISCVLVILCSTMVLTAGTPEDGAVCADTPIAFSEGPMPIERQLRIAGSVLRPRGSEPTFTSISGGCIYAQSDGWQVWNAPVYLPQGATVTQMRFYFFDGDAQDSWAWFTAYDYEGFVDDEWGAASFGNTGSGYVTIEPINHVIDYSTHSYVVNWRPVVAGSTMKVCGFRIWYTMP